MFRAKRPAESTAIPAGLRSFGIRHLAFGLFALCAGCSHYRLGTGARLDFRTIYVAPVENQTLLPQARELVSTQLRAAFARDGRLALASSPEAADVTLRVTITDYHREVATPREGDTGLARKFNLVLTVLCTLHDHRGGAGGKDLFANRPVTVQREAFTDSGQLQSEYQTLPLLAESLAQKVTHAVLDVW